MNWTIKDIWLTSKKDRLAPHKPTAAAGAAVTLAGALAIGLLALVLTSFNSAVDAAITELIVLGELTEEEGAPLTPVTSPGTVGLVTTGVSTGRGVEGWLTTLGGDIGGPNWRDLSSTNK
jgi:hypothetical protein